MFRGKVYLFYCTLRQIDLFSTKQVRTLCKINIDIFSVKSKESNNEATQTEKNTSPQNSRNKLNLSKNKTMKDMAAEAISVSSIRTGE